MCHGKRPTPEFRREAVRLALTSGRTRREIADDLGAGLPTLTRWAREERDAVAPQDELIDLLVTVSGRTWCIWPMSGPQLHCRTAAMAARACIVT